MTPTVTRMVAKKRRDFAYPLRLYSIPNVFRYERPQKGRLREHWQLNADIFGAPGEFYEVELILLADSIMKEFGATQSDYVFKINSREEFDVIFNRLDLPDKLKAPVLRVMDKKDKLSEEEFRAELEKLLANKTGEFILALLDISKSENLLGFKNKLEKLGVENIDIYPYLARGFDYYTGFIFEVFDTNKDNPRSLFGGGRYDNLMEKIGEEKLEALGFGMGDVSLLEFLKLRNLLPEYKPATDLAILTAGVSDALLYFAFDLSLQLRKYDIAVAINANEQKLDKKIKGAEKLGIRFISIVGESEIQNGELNLKDLKTGKSYDRINIKEISDIIFSSEI